jgi:hypothetical protein
VTGFGESLAQIAAILVAAGAVGWGAAAALTPPGSIWRSERLAWGFAAGLSVLAVSVAIAFGLRIGPGGLAFLLVAGPVVVGARFLRIRERIPIEGEARSLDVVIWIFGTVLVTGVALYALRALTEPMWANDYVAIWGLKGKIFFAERRIPERLFHWRSLSFSHPEYPLGLPFLYAGIAFLLGRWDDHAMALLFPFLQVATLLTLFGWLRRRGASRQMAIGAAAVLSQFEPLYRGFTTGMAEVPLSFGLLLLGTSLSDRIDRTDRGASRRLALSSFLCAGTKNEGLFLVAAALVVGALSSLSRKGFAARAAAILALPAALVLAVHRLIRGSLPLRDFDFVLLRRPAALLPRIGESLSTAVREIPVSAWIALAALAVLLAVGRPLPAGERLLALAACAVAAYLFLPSLAVLGPAWLVRTSFARTTAALAPLVAAGIAVRLVPVFGKRKT